MKTYGLEMQGRFIIQKIQSLPTWSSYDEGRFIYIFDEDAYYIGGILNWIQVAKGNNSIVTIKTSDIIVDSTLNYFEPTVKLNDALDGLADGHAIIDNAIESRHIYDNAIRSNHVKFGFSEDSINGSLIPCYDSIENKNSKIQTVLDNIISRMTQTVRKKVQLTAWQYNMVEKLYVTTIYFNPIRKDYINIQCYDDQGIMILPAKIKVTPDIQQVEISTPYRLIMNVVITG